MLGKRNLSRVFPTDSIQTTALDSINLKVEAGEFLVVTGPSGLRQTRPAQHSGHAGWPSGGSYVFNGEEVAGLSESHLAALRKGNIGFIFQSFNLIDEKSVRENIELELPYRDLSARERRARADAVMDKVDIGHLAGNYPSQLSYDQQ